MSFSLGKIKDNFVLRKKKDKTYLKNLPFRISGNSSMMQAQHVEGRLEHSTTFDNNSDW